MKACNMSILILFFASFFFSCKKDGRVESSKKEPRIENLELGLSNSRYGVVGRDFHLEADIVAGDRIDRIEIYILQKAGETYEKAWKYEVAWEESKGLKNANLHKHFDIPADAPQGNYHFLIVVRDQNGSRLELKHDFIIYSDSNAPR